MRDSQRKMKRTQEPRTTMAMMGLAMEVEGWLDHPIQKKAMAKSGAA
jgi:hypothetical protein